MINLRKRTFYLNKPLRSDTESQKFWSRRDLKIPVETPLMEQVEAEQRVISFTLNDVPTVKLSIL
jgi:hypothetical protein